MLKERLSGIENLTAGEMKGMSLTSAKRRLYKNQIHGKLLKAPKMVLSKVWQGVHFYVAVFLTKSDASSSFHRQWGFRYHLSAP